jgi:hypothetical protein
MYAIIPIPRSGYFALLTESIGSPLTMLYYSLILL